MEPACARVLEAELELVDGCDPAADGAAVTVELCGRWEHGGACRWPHNGAIDAEREPARFRTLFVAPRSEEPVVRRRIEASGSSPPDCRGPLTSPDGRSSPCRK